MRTITTILLVFQIISSKAQYFYIDVSPDSCVCATSSSGTSNTISTLWDLDNNGVNDFIIESKSSNAGASHVELETTKIFALGSNKVVGNPTGAARLNSGDSINTQTTWLSNGDLMWFNGFSGYGGNWWWANYGSTIATDGFIGIQFYSGPTLYYGWIKVLVNANLFAANVIVKEYAYGLCPTTCYTSIFEELNRSSASIFPNPVSDKVTVKTNGSDEHFMIYDAFGKLVFEEALISGENNLNIDLPPGLYIYRIINNKMETRRGKIQFN